MLDLMYMHYNDKKIVLSELERITSKLKEA